MQKDSCHLLVDTNSPINLNVAGAPCLKREAASITRANSSRVNTKNHANIFFVKDGKIHTPLADCFLDGLTRQTVIGLARKRGFEVIERRILHDELTGFSECFITGSAAEVTAVSEIANWNFNPGGITKQLMDDYTAEVKPTAKAAAA